MARIKQMMAQWSLKNDTDDLRKDMQEWAGRYDMYLQGFLPVTQQRNFSVMLRRDGKNRGKVLRGLKILVPLLKDFPNDQKLAAHVYVGVFEHGLSEEAAYSMLISRDLLSGCVIRHCYGRQSIAFQGTMTALMAYLSNNLWYYDFAEVA